MLPRRGASFWRVFRFPTHSRSKRDVGSPAAVQNLGLENEILYLVSRYFKVCCLFGSGRLPLMHIRSVLGLCRATRWRAADAVPV